MNQEDIIENLFSDKYTHDEKMSVLAELERENSPLLDELIKKHQPLFWSENYISEVPQGYKFPGYQKHIMEITLAISLEKYKINPNYNPKIDFSLTKNLLHL